MIVRDPLDQSLESQPIASKTAAASARRVGRGRARTRGFTLIELMITVAIVAILAAIAYPSYTAYIVRSNRSAAQGYMLELTNLEQRYLLDSRGYATGLAALNVTALPSNVAPNYDINPVADNTTTPPSFTITAKPKLNQATNDTACAILTIDQAGTKTASGTSGVAGCW